MYKKILIAYLIVLYYSFCIGNNIQSHLPNENDSLRVVEKVYIHTDRNIYYSGDDIWFKAYLVDALYCLPTTHSKNLHVEIISPESKIIVKRVIRINDGQGNGDFQLPESIPSGRYILRAYTNYMRNYGDQLFYSKVIIVLNSIEKKNEPNDSIKSMRNKIDISFFPEGGSLVDSVSSNITFKAVNSDGIGCDVSGEIYSSTNELVTTIKSTRLGMGKFSLKPISGLNYYAIAKNLNGDIVKVDLPKSFSTGVTLCIDQNHNNKQLLKVEMNKKTLPLLLDHELLLTISARKVVLKTIRFRIKTISKSFILPIDDLPNGIAMLTLSTIDSLPLAERLIFVQHNDYQVKVLTDKTEYKNREQVTVNITFPSYKTTTQEAFLSLSAVENNSLDNSTLFPSTISSWFLLESDLRGSIEEPSYYFDPTNLNRLDDLELLLMTQGWRDFGWKYDSTGYYPPESGFTISGRVRKSLFNMPVINSMVSIELHNSKNSIMKSVFTDSLGRFYLKNVDFTGNSRLIISTLSNKKRLQGLVLLDSICYIPAKVQYDLTKKRILQKEKYIVQIQYAEQKETIRKKYHLSDTILLDGINVIATKQKIDIQLTHVNNVRSIYGQPDEEIEITPAYQNTHLVELIRRAKGFIIQGEGTNVSIMLHGPGTFGSPISSPNSMPLFLIDGVPTSFINAYYFPVSSIDRVDFLTSPTSTSKYGMQGGDGVISIITKSGIDISTEEPVENENVNKTRIMGYNAPRVFYSPQYNNSDKESVYKPDQRTTLYWQPNIKLDNKKSFSLNYFNTDNPSTIKVVVEGITKDGVPIVGKTEYNIR
ncbi:MAG: hypothetical protein EHM93_12610 [Bacteroidales bacterium]|nr:MAG: hypothetical protein EHM93_12610 [Bacteroidales bacterium]